MIVGSNKMNFIFALLFYFKNTAKLELWRSRHRQGSSFLSSCVFILAFLPCAKSEHAITGRDEIYVKAFSKSVNI